MVNLDFEHESLVETNFMCPIFTFLLIAPQGGQSNDNNNIIIIHISANSCFYSFCDPSTLMNCYHEGLVTALG